MSQKISPIDLQQAWQTAFLLRTCPSDAVLRAKEPDENLAKHLASCSICREKRAMPAEQVAAWQKLFDKFASQTHKAITEPQPGQVWILKKEMARWGDDGFYYSPPNILLLEKLDDNGRFRAAQLYSDKRLMGDGDVWMGDRFGFAQGWNTYVISKDALDCWLGVVTDAQFAEILQSSATKYHSLEDHSVLSLFRGLEKKVGLYAVLSPPPRLQESVEGKVIDLIPGLKLTVADAGGFLLDITMDTLELLRGTFKPALVLRGGAPKPLADKLSDESKKLMQDSCRVVPVDLKISDDTLTVSLRWLQGRPSKLPKVLASLNGTEVSEESINTISIDQIAISHYDISNISISQICRFRIEFVGNILKLDISAEQ